MPTASNMEFSSLVAILRIRLKKKVSKHQPIATQHEHDGDQAHEIVNLKKTVEIVDDETANHEHLPMGKIQNVHDAENQRDPERDQRVVDSQNDAIDEHLLQVGILQVGYESRKPRRSSWLV